MTAAALYALVLSARLVRLDQPIWEGYIGRQVPTAMVARNLLRDGDFLRPKLDTGPFPSLFLVEPPIYAGAAGLVSILTGLPLEAAGRCVSALGTTLAAWGLYGLARRREGADFAARLVLFFGFFPVALRYGRAFQPDALMLGLVLAGLRCSESERRSARVAGWMLTAAGLATKVTGAFLLFAPARPTGPKGRFVRFSTLLPAACWYVWAVYLMRAGASGTSASSGNAANWAERLTNVFAWNWEAIARDWLHRAFSPLGFVLIVVGLIASARLDPFWRRLGLATAAALVVLAGKLHHGYYELLAAPIAAALASHAVGRWVGNRRASGWAIPWLFVILSVAQTRSTWSTPGEWLGLSEAGAKIRRFVPPGAVLIAREAVVYAADRPGCRWETEPAAIRRAAAEWGGRADSATDLLRLYVAKSGADYFAELRSGDGPASPNDAIRRLSGVETLIDEPDGLLLLRLGAEGPANAESR